MERAVRGRGACPRVNLAYRCATSTTDEWTRVLGSACDETDCFANTAANRKAALDFALTEAKSLTRVCQRSATAFYYRFYWVLAADAMGCRYSNRSLGLGSLG